MDEQIDLEQCSNEELSKILHDEFNSLVEHMTEIPERLTEFRQLFGEFKRRGLSTQNEISSNLAHMFGNAFDDDEQKQLTEQVIRGLVENGMDPNIQLHDKYIEKVPITLFVKAFREKYLGLVAYLIQLPNAIIVPGILDEINAEARQYDYIREVIISRMTGTAPRKRSRYEQ